MPISDKRKLIFIHIPKNAGTALMDSLDIKKTGHQFAEHYMKFINKWNSYKKIAIIRNPWDRVVSNYEYARMEKSYWHDVNGGGIFGKHKDYDLLKNLSFKECIKLLSKNPKLFKHQGWKSQYPYVCDINDNVIVDTIIRYENLSSDFKKLFPDTKLLVKNSSFKKKRYEEYYDIETIELISKIYEKDITLWNYEKPNINNIPT